MQITINRVLLEPSAHLINRLRLSIASRKETNWLTCSISISTRQCDFTAGRWRITDALGAMYCFSREHKEGRVSHAICIDFAKAHHIRILLNLESQGIWGQMTALYHSLFMGSTFTIRSSRCFSKPFHIHTGILQGASRGLLLLWIYNNFLQRNIPARLAVHIEDYTVTSTEKKQLQSVSSASLSTRRCLQMTGNM